MSRIGMSPVELPSGISGVVSGQRVEVTGPKGVLSYTAADDVSITQDGQKITLVPRRNSKRARQLWGLSRTMVANCVEGVVNGFRKELVITGIGYRAQMRAADQALTLTVGLSHQVVFEPRDGLTVTLPSQTRIVIEGGDKQKVGQLAAEIRSVRPPEPYKGKGIRYADEVVQRKVGKKK